MRLMAEKFDHFRAQGLATSAALTGKVATDTIVAMCFLVVISIGKIQ